MKYPIRSSVILDVTQPPYCADNTGKTDCTKVNVSVLQSKLEKADIMVHFPDDYVPEDRTVVIHGKNTAEIDGGHL